MWDKRAYYISNHDGDTVKMKLDQGFDDEKTISVRLLGVFAPELSQPGGKECKDFVADWFNTNRIATTWSFIVTTARMKEADHEQETLARYVGTVTTLDSRRNLNLDVMEFIAAKGYGGGIGSKEMTD